jgi:hypothetical protein
MEVIIRELQESDDLEQITDFAIGDLSQIIRVLLCQWLWNN